MGYFLSSHGSVDDHIAAIKEGDTNFVKAMNNTQTFISNVRPYISSVKLPIYFNLEKVPSNLYALYIQASPNFVAEGFSMSETQLRSAIKNLKDQLNLILATDQDIIYYWNRKAEGISTSKAVPQLQDNNVIITANIPSDRLLAVDAAGGPVAASGGGSAAPQPVPFIIGPGWHTFNYRGLNTDEGRWEYIESPNPQQFITHGKLDRKATIYVLDKEGKTHYSTTSFIIRGMSKGHMTSQSRIPTFDKDILMFYKEKSRAIEIRGVLLNSEDYDLARAWQTDWETHLSGAVTSQNNTRFYMLCGGWVLSGNLIGYRINKNANRGRFADALTFTVQVSQFKPLPKLQIIERASGIAEAWKDKGNRANPNNYLKGKGIKYLRPGQTLTEAKSAKSEAPEDTTPEGKDIENDVSPGSINDSIV